MGEITFSRCHGVSKATAGFLPSILWGRVQLWSPTQAAGNFENCSSPHGTRNRPVTVTDLGETSTFAKAAPGPTQCDPAAGPASSRVLVTVLVPHGGSCLRAFAFLGLAFQGLLPPRLLARLPLTCLRQASHLHPAPVPVCPTVQSPPGHVPPLK